MEKLLGLDVNKAVSDPVHYVQFCMCVSVLGFPIRGQ